MSCSWRTPRTIKPNFQNPTPEICPATRFFDQLSFIGDEIVGCFVLETEIGLVLLDCMNPEQRCIELIENGIHDLGLDINDLQAIIISHGHGDHYGMADYFQKKYGVKIYLSETDFEYAKHLPEFFPWEPIQFHVDHFLQDGEVLEFGNTKIKVVFTPGHTMGTCSFIIPVTDEGRTHHMAMWGGSGIMPDSDKEAYYRSLLKFTKLCKEYHVDGEISSHPSLDMGLIRYAMVRSITDGMPNPFILGEEGYHYYERQFYNYVKEIWDR